jgi:hypothetical protein
MFAPAPVPYDHGRIDFWQLPPFYSDVKWEDALAVPTRPFTPGDCCGGPSR